MMEGRKEGKDVEKEGRNVRKGGMEGWKEWKESLRTCQAKDD